jgi:hypothetical protein
VKFIGVTRDFSLVNEGQYDTIGAFWDEMTAVYGLENLVGLGYRWCGDTISYAIGLCNGVIAGANLCIDLPNGGWCEVDGETDRLPSIYDEIYKSGRLTYELEYFFENGKCHIKYYR